MRWWNRRAPRSVALGLAALVAVTVVVPQLRARAKAVAVVAHALDGSMPRPLAAAVTRTEVVLGGVVGDLYSPRGPAPAVVLVPGATPLGRDDHRVVRVAEAVAAARRVVFVPELALYQEQVLPEDAERLVRATLALREDPRARGRPTLAGFSFGGSMALLAAADPQLDGQLTQVAVFGAYADLVGVLQAATTGVALVDGVALPWRAHPDAEQVVRDQLLALLPAGARRELSAALAGRGDPADLDPALRAIYDLLANTDPAATYVLAERLPDELRGRLAEVSPVHVLDRIRVPIVAMHSTDDPLVPYGEAVRLRSHRPDVRLVSLTRFEHVDFHATSPGAWWRASRDLAAVWRFASWVLSPQEPGVPRWSRPSGRSTTSGSAMRVRTVG